LDKEVAAMLRFFVNKVAEAIVVLFLVTLGTAGLVNLIPGSPALLILGSYATPSSIATLNKQYGFNRPFFDRYWSWLTGALHGNLGNSIQSQEPVTHILQSALPVTLEIALLALVISLLIAIPLALVCAARDGSLLDRAVTGVSSALQAIPTFVGCVVLAELFSNKFHVFPTFGWTPLSQDPGQNLLHVALPVIVLVLVTTPLFLRVLRADLVAVLREDYVLSARARGLPDWYIMLRHALRPASVSLFTLTGLVFGYLVGGVVILETFFALPGIGQAVATAVSGKDLPVVQGAVVVFALTYLVLNTLVDLGLALIDPQSRRIR
jgi:peptide/nickel transport system permease protein